MMSFILSEFHINPSDGVMYMVKGEMRLHYRTPEGREEVAVIPEGSVIYTPAGTPYSPRFPPYAFALILARAQEARRGNRPLPLVLPQVRRFPP